MTCDRCYGCNLKLVSPMRLSANLDVQLHEESSTGAVLFGVGGLSHA